MKQRFKLDAYFIGGIILAFWAFLNTYVDIIRYGVDQGFYWWFCNLALIGVAGGLLCKHRGWLTGFLSIACFTQIFWILDNNYRVLTGENLFGLVEFMYHPGLPMDEFLLSHYHYITIPVSILALCHLPKGKSNSRLLICIFNPLIFAVSYFIFPRSQNVNCIHEPCISSFESWGGPLYAFSFWLVIFSVHLALGTLFENFFLHFEFTEKRKLWMRRGAIALAVCTLFIGTADTFYKLSIPRFRCTDLVDNNTSPVNLTCGFTLDHSPGVMSLNYWAENKTDLPQDCVMHIRYEDQDEKMGEFELSPRKRERLSVLLRYPERSVTGRISARCTENRAITSH